MLAELSLAVLWISNVLIALVNWNKHSFGSKPVNQLQRTEIFRGSSVDTTGGRVPARFVRQHNWQICYDNKLELPPPMGLYFKLSWLALHFSSYTHRRQNTIKLIISPLSASGWFCQRNSLRVIFHSQECYRDAVLGSPKPLATCTAGADAEQQINRRVEWLF